MVLIGLLLMLACVAIAVDAIVENASAIPATAFNQSFTDLSVGELFVAGAVLGLLFALGMALFTGGLGRAARRRRERKELVARNERLESRLSDDRSTGAYPDEPATTANPASRCCRSRPGSRSVATRGKRTVTTPIGRRSRTRAQTDATP